MNEALIIGLLAGCVMFDAWIVCILNSLHDEVYRIRILLAIMAAGRGNNDKNRNDKRN